MSKNFLQTIRKRIQRADTCTGNQNAEMNLLIDVKLVFLGEVGIGGGVSINYISSGQNSFALLSVFRNLRSCNIVQSVTVKAPDSCRIR